MALLNILDKFKKKDKSADRYKRKEKTVKEEAILGEEEKAEVKKEGIFKIKESAFASKILISPIVTEKSAHLTESSKYVFKVKPTSTKPEIKRAVEEVYGVKVRQVNVIKKPAKKRIFRGRIGRKPGYSKAVVSLAEGNKIEFI
ncbi:MAG: 50S ribosomal protein L23 [Candidatus Niyogibacteria bacterium CG10_big_fil_rev_8_21_14_0_10_42_19]|uniref:Large ribosomal subunit protein uL23 n=1 Tax=Candidatus Niyogibacteria bacterium CG10_big_fil_rev_8_21_14_0_10_42_19 TaxID=1974725 RepID=A0A2H0TGZ0_9BACT|nr:MAG: 50S ribosomal protein L23 [Candidatus Niyogibacteria bacterium CG10_big_fil_rev_8_21_14_0_10_42_19]